MVDKLLVVTRSLSSKWTRYASKHGVQRWGYASVVDLRKSPAKLPVMLFCGGLRDGINKIEIVNIAALKFAEVKRILRELVPDWSRARIFRIDLAVDLPNVHVWDLAEACFVPRAQNLRYFRTRGVVSYYLQCSRSKSILVYDRGKRISQIEKNADRRRSTEPLTRLEVQLKGKGVPFKKISNLPRYAECDLLAAVHFRRSVRPRRNLKGHRFLAAYGLRRLIDRYGQQATAKLLGASNWAHVRKTLLHQKHPANLPDIAALLKASIAAWFDGDVAN